MQERRIWLKKKTGLQWELEDKEVGGGAFPKHGLERVRRLLIHGRNKRFLFFRCQPEYLIAFLHTHTHTHAHTHKYLHKLLARISTHSNTKAYNTCIRVYCVHRHSPSFTCITYLSYTIQYVYTVYIDILPT